jgi:hypothetical protein
MSIKKVVSSNSCPNVQNLWEHFQVFFILENIKLYSQIFSPVDLHADKIIYIKFD